MKVSCCDHALLTLVYVVSLGGGANGNEQKSSGLADGHSCSWKSAWPGPRLCRPPSHLSLGLIHTGTREAKWLTPGRTARLDPRPGSFPPGLSVAPDRHTPRQGLSPGWGRGLSCVRKKSPWALRVPEARHRGEGLLKVTEHSWRPECQPPALSHLWVPPLVLHRLGVPWGCRRHRLQPGHMRLVPLAGS